MADDVLLDEVRQAADAALEARAGGDASDGPMRRARAAARAALDGGHGIASIASAEAAGERAARERVGGQVLRAVERLARKLCEATEEYERAIVHATRLGLPARDIAARAGISHGTVAALARRHKQPPVAPPEQDAPKPVEDVTPREPAPEPGTG